jgi:hypothetical protein
VIEEQAKEAGRPEPKGKRVGSPDLSPGDGDINCRRTNRTQPPRSNLPIKQQGKPHPSRRKAEAQPQGKVMTEGVEESRRKRMPSCNGMDRTCESGEYPARKGADFRQVSAEAMEVEAITDRRR